MNENIDKLKEQAKKAGWWSLRAAGVAASAVCKAMACTLALSSAVLDVMTDKIKAKEDEYNGK